MVKRPATLPRSKQRNDPLFPIKIKYYMEQPPGFRGLFHMLKPSIRISLPQVRHPGRQKHPGLFPRRHCLPQALRKA